MVVVVSRGALRYVVLRHDGIDDPHYDLMFESPSGGGLATWRSTSWPIEQRTPVVKLPDHRLDYLDYEGPVSGNRGTVIRVARGTYHLGDSRLGDWLIRWTAAPGGLLLEKVTGPEGAEEWYVCPMWPKREPHGT